MQTEIKSFYNTNNVKIKSIYTRLNLTVCWIVLYFCAVIISIVISWFFFSLMFSSVHSMRHWWWIWYEIVFFIRSVWIANESDEKLINIPWNITEWYKNSWLSTQFSFFSSSLLHCWLLLFFFFFLVKKITFSTWKSS